MRAFASPGGATTEESVEVAFFGVDVIEIGGFDVRDVDAAGRYDAGFDDELDEGAGGDVFLAYDLKEGLFDVDEGELAGD